MNLYESQNNYTESIAVMLVQSGEKNSYDQEGLVQGLKEEYGKQLIRLDWQSFREQSIHKGKTLFM